MAHSIIPSDNGGSSLGKPYTIKELAKELGVSYSKIIKILEDTENIGYTVEVKSGKPTRFNEWQADYIRNQISLSKGAYSGKECFKGNIH